MPEFKAGDRVCLLVGNITHVGTVVGTSDNPHYDVRLGSKYPLLYDVLWDGSETMTVGYLPFMLDLLPKDVSSSIIPTEGEGTKNISQLQKEIHEWSTRNFGSKVTISSKYDVGIFMQMVRELGKIAHGILKLSQGIRGTEDAHHKKIKRAAHKLIHNSVLFLDLFLDGDVPEPVCNMDISSFLGVVEEVGEIADSINSDDEIDAVKDGIADVMIYLLDFCGRNGLDADAILAETWGKVKERDWKKNSENGEA